MPLKDYSGKTIGILAVPNDVTAALSKLETQIWYFFLVATGMLIAAKLLLFTVTAVPTFFVKDSVTY